MSKRYYVLVLLLTFFVLGCEEQNQNFSVPSRRPLGESIATFEPPVSPSAPASAESRIVEPTGVMSMRESLALALLYNPELKSYSWNVRAAEAEQLQASLWPNPEVDFEMENVGGSGDFSGVDGAETTIALTQLIELAGKIRKRTHIASLKKELSGWDYEAKRLDVLSEVGRSYIEVLAAQERLALTEELLQLSQDMVDTVTKRVDAGKDSPLEKTKALVAFSGIEISHRQAKENLAAARKHLASTWASNDPKFDRVDGNLDSVSPVPSIDVLRGLIGDNPDIARWTTEIDKGRAVLELERAKATQDIKLGAGVKRLSETDDNTLVFGVTIPIPLYDRNQGARQRAIYDLASAQQQRKAAYTKTEIELVEAYRGLVNSYTQAVELNENVLQGAESVFEASRTGYIKGKLDYLNVLDSQRTMFEAKAQYIDALASYHKAKADVERLIGRSIGSVRVSKSEGTK